MAEVAATTVGIAGAVSVLQSLLKCYKDFTVARSFPTDYATMVLRATLIESSTRIWGESVGLIDHTGAAQNQFFIANPTEKNTRLATRTLKHITELMEDANEVLGNYSPEYDIPASSTTQLLSSRETNHASKLRKVCQKLAGTVDHPKGPGPLKRTIWALIDKEELEKKLCDVTTLLDRLNADFQPKAPNAQVMNYYNLLQSLGIDDGEMSLIATVAVDQVSISVARFALENHTPGNTFESITLNGQAILHQGDYVAADYISPGPQGHTSTRNTFKVIEGNDRSMVSVGNQYGGKSPIGLALERTSLHEG